MADSKTCLPTAGSHSEMEFEDASVGHLHGRKHSSSSPWYLLSLNLWNGADIIDLPKL
jgi:hypothetical protein